MAKKLSIIRFDPIKLATKPPLFEALETLGIRAEDARELLGVSDQAWYHWCHGARNCPPPTQVFLTVLCILAIQRAEEALVDDTLTAERKAGAGLISDWKKKLRENIKYAKQLIEWQMNVNDSFSQEDKDAGKALALSIEARLPEKNTKKTATKTKTTKAQKRT